MEEGLENKSASVLVPCHLKSFKKYTCNDLLLLRLLHITNLYCWAQRLTDSLTCHKNKCIAQYCMVIS